VTEKLRKKSKKKIWQNGNCFRPLPAASPLLFEEHEENEARHESQQQQKLSCSF
jgi:hypothetical protein